MTPTPIQDNNAALEITEMRKDIESLQNNHIRLDHAVNGNGQPGIRQKVDALDKKITWMMGGLAALMFVLNLMNG